jgi:hypothetical protein
MNQTNPIIIFWGLLGFRRFKGRAKSDAINQIDAMAGSNASIVMKLSMLHDATVESSEFAAMSRSLFYKSKKSAAKMKSMSIQANAIASKISDSATRICTEETRESAVNAESIAYDVNYTLANVEILTAQARSLAKYASIKSKRIKKDYKTISNAINSKSYADEIFAKACFSVINSRTSISGLPKAIFGACAISVVNLYANSKFNYALRAYNAEPQDSESISIFNTLERTFSQLNSFEHKFTYPKQRAWDIKLITTFTQSLAEIFPKEWNEWQHWISDMMEDRSRMQTNGLNHRLVSLITFYRLTLFALHIGIVKVFILATRRTTR